MQSISEGIYKMYISALDEVAVDFSNPSQKDIQMYYDIGVVWYFINAIDANGFSGNVHKVTDMDADNYYAYLENRLEVFKVNPEGVVPFQKLLDMYSGVSYKIISNLILKPKDIKFGDGRSFMKELKKSHVQSTDFSQLVKTFSDGFIYEDSPYFLTTGYNPDFGDEQHKIMLDQLRDSDFKWLFSMQYREFHTNKASKGNSKRTSAQKAGQPLIKCYRDYFAGFVNEFTVQYEGKKPYYTSNPDVLSSLADDYCVILFRNSKDTAEMMICNFDVRRVIPLAEKLL